MKKRIQALIISMSICIVAFTGCGEGIERRAPGNNGANGDSNVTVVDNRKDASENKVESVTDEQFEKKGYLYENSIGDSLYFYVVKNNSAVAVEISGSATAKDAEGNVLGASQKDIDVLGAGETSLMCFYFHDVKNIDYVDCALAYDTKPYYSPVISYIALEQSINDKNLTIVATNTGNVNAQFVEAYALFFDAENNVVSYASSYVTDGDSEIKPGATIAEQLDAYKAFDHVECYLTGRSNGEVSAVSTDVSDADFAVKEYSYVDSLGTSYYYLAITNNSTKTVGININLTAYDGDNNVIGAGSSNIDVIGPTEESIAYFYLKSVTGIDHVSYNMNYDTTPYYESGLKDLNIVQNVNSKNVVVTVTNNGSEATKFLEAYAIFLDASGNVVGTDSGYVTDGDSEIKPGATLSKQLDCRKAFKSVVVYFTGRR